MGRHSDGRRKGFARAVVMAAGLAWALAGGAAGPAGADRGARVGQPAPDIAGGPWVNSAPLSMEKLRGRVVLVEFWTYG